MCVTPLGGTEHDEDQLILGSILFVALSVRAFLDFRELKKFREEEVDGEVKPPEPIKITNRATYIKLFIVTIILTASFSIWQYYELSKFESGEVDYIVLWGPLELIYHFGGFWVTVSVFPAMCVFVIIVGIRKLIKNEFDSQDDDDDDQS